MKEGATLSPSFLIRLDLDHTADERAVRRAYPRELKKIDQEADLEGFQALRAAYESAVRWLQYKEGMRQWDEEGEGASESPRLQLDGSALSRVESAGQTRSLSGPASSSEDEKEVSSFLDGGHPAVRRAYERFLQQFLADEVCSAALAELWRQRLDRLLAEELFVSLTARQALEQCFADLLAEGWKPGHDWLFSICADSFSWSEERRLRRLGEAGALLERALHERALLDSQPPQARRALEDVIQRVRQPKEPSGMDLCGWAEQLETLVEYCPALSWIVTDSARLRHWFELVESYPPQHPPPSAQQSEPYRQDAKRGMPWYIVLPLIYALLKILGSMPGCSG